MEWFFAGSGLILGAGVVLLVVWLRVRRTTGVAPRAAGRPARDAPPVAQPRRHPHILIVGLGGVGKTTLVRNAFLNRDADPTQKTLNFAFYGTALSWRKYPGLDGPGTKATDVHCYVSDYRGQDLGSLLKSTQLDPNFRSALRRAGPISQVVIVVDVAAPPERREPHPHRVRPDADRIQENNSQWSDLALDAVFSVPDRLHLRDVCLFINKVGILENQGPALEDELRRDYTVLIDRLALRCRRLDPRLPGVLVGDAETGRGCPALLERSLASVLPGIPVT